MRELVHLQPKQITNRRRPEVGTRATAAPRNGDDVGQRSENQKAANLLALVLALATFAISTGTFIVTGLLPGVASDLSVSVGTAGHLVTVFAVAYALSSPVLVALTGRVARRRLLVSTLTMSALANLAAAAAPTFSLLLATRVASACCAAICMPVAIATAAQLAPPGQKGRALSIAGGGISAAWLLGVPSGAVLVDYFGWRVSFVLAATLAILASIAVRALLPKVRSVPSTGGLRSRLAVAGRPLVLVTLVVTILAMVSGFTVLTYVRPLLEGLTGFGGEGIGSMLLLFGLAAVLGSVLGGYGADRWGYRASIIPMLILQALVLLLFSVLSVLGAASAVTIVVAAAAVATWGVVGFALVPLQQYRMIEVAPDEQNGVLSLNSSAVYAGQGLGAGLGSLVLGHASLASLGYVGALLAVAALTVFLLGTRALAKGPSQKKGFEPARIPYSK
jgi:predicted MFS family arabinose efflux permease